MSDLHVCASSPTVTIVLVCRRRVGSGDVEPGGGPTLSTTGLAATMVATTAATSEAE